jgi:hypothetical protein
MMMVKYGGAYQRREVVSDVGKRENVIECENIKVLSEAYLAGDGVCGERNGTER